MRTEPTGPSKHGWGNPAPGRWRAARLVRKLGVDLPPAVRRVVADAWLLRYVIEMESELRFQALAPRLAASAALEDLVERAKRASSDERRHAAECALYVEAYGGDVSQVAVPQAAREFAPQGLGPLERLTYEMVTTCCIAETQSAGNLVTLYNATPPEPMLTSLRALSRDEVTHSQLGWAFLEWVRSRMNIAFLAPLLPQMLNGGGRRKLVQPAPQPERNDPRLLSHGVLPHATRQEVFVSTLEDVVFPGFERAGVDTAPSRAWLKEAQSPPA
jgi:hypothetical protein